MGVVWACAVRLTRRRARGRRREGWWNCKGEAPVMRLDLASRENRKGEGKNGRALRAACPPEKQKQKKKQIPRGNDRKKGKGKRKGESEGQTCQP